MGDIYNHWADDVFARDTPRLTAHSSECALQANVPATVGDTNGGKDGYPHKNDVSIRKTISPPGME